MSRLDVIETGTEDVGGKGVKGITSSGISSSPLPDSADFSEICLSVFILEPSSESSSSSKEGRS